MIIKFDSLDRYEHPDFILCNPGSLRTNNGPTYSLGMLTGVSDVEIIFNFNEVSELSMRVTKFDYEGYGTEFDEDIAQDILDRYKLLENRRLLYNDDLGYFIITNIDERFDNGVEYKDIKAESLEAEFKQKNIPYFADGTYQFYNNNVASLGLLNQIIDVMPNWSIDHIDQSLENVYRTFEDVDETTNCLAFLIEEMQEAYSCVFEFDTRLRTVSAYAQDNYVSQTNIMITKNDIVDGLTITENADDLYTALGVRSSDDTITVGALNPTGSNTIYKFDYYLDWMTPALSARVRQWQNAIADAETPYRTLNEQYYDYLTAYNNALLEVERQETILNIYERLYNNIAPMRNFASSTSTLNSYNTSLAKYGAPQLTPAPTVAQTQSTVQGWMNTVKVDLAAANAAASTAQQNAIAVRTQIRNNYQTPLSISNYFTSEELRELSNYIFEGTYNDDYVIVTDSMTYAEKFDQMQVLYDRAKTQLRRVAQPAQEFEVDVESFVFVKEFERWTAQLKTGCSVNVELDRDDWAVLFLSAITVNYEDHDLRLTFGDRLNKYDRRKLFQDLLGSVSKSANTISYVKDLTTPLKDGQFDRMAETLRTAKDITMETALAETNEQVVIDGSGYTGKKVENGTTDDKQVKIVHNAIVFTDDAWQTSRTAVGEFTYVDPVSLQNVTTYGVVADTLAGNLILGQNVGIYNAGQSVSITQDGFIITVPSTSVSTNLFKIRKNDGHGNYTNLLYVDSNGNLNMTGSITASSGSIGGWIIGQHELYASVTRQVYQTQQVPVGYNTVPAYDSSGNPIYERDLSGNIIYDTVITDTIIGYDTTKPILDPMGDPVLDADGNPTYEPIYQTEQVPRQATTTETIYETQSVLVDEPVGTYNVLKSSGNTAIGIAADTLQDGVPDPSSGLFRVSTSGDVYAKDINLYYPNYGSGITFKRALANNFMSEARIWIGPNNPSDIMLATKTSAGVLTNVLDININRTQPYTNLSHTLGGSKNRWYNIYTGSINVSDKAIIGSTLSMTDTGNRTFTCIRAYKDEDSQNRKWGTNLVIEGEGNTFIGSGESAQNIYDAEYKGTGFATCEFLNLTSDSNMYFYVNCQIPSGKSKPANRRYARLDTNLVFVPHTDDGVDNLSSLGSSGSRWKNIYSVNAPNVTSDRKVKKNIEDIYHAKELIMGIEPKQFMFTLPGSDRLHYGFIAQQFKEAMTEADIDDCGAFTLDITAKAMLDGYTRDTAPEEEKIYGLRYEELIAPIVAVIQEQEKRIKELERIINNG
ncbi:MAG TPA: hypothetical protein DCG33_01300 [Prevotellaceae bacterium]|nr:hypothetical protein [Prevotellaceae bacterium]